MTTAPTPPTAEALAGALSLIDTYAVPGVAWCTEAVFGAVCDVARAAVDLVTSDPDWWAERPGNGRVWCSLCQGWRAEVSTPAEVVHADDCPALAIVRTVVALAALAAPAEAVAP